jgi:hypothetical protein
LPFDFAGYERAHQPIENILADRDPQLAIVYVLVIMSIAFLGEERFSLNARLFSRMGSRGEKPN